MLGCRASSQHVQWQGKEGPNPIRRSSFPALFNHAPAPFCLALPHGSTRSAGHIVAFKIRTNTARASRNADIGPQNNQSALFLAYSRRIPHIGPRGSDFFVPCSTLWVLPDRGPHPEGAKLQWCCFTSPRTGDLGRLAGVGGTHDGTLRYSRGGGETSGVQVQVVPKNSPVRQKETRQTYDSGLGGKLL